MVLNVLPIEVIENICNFLELDSLNKLKNVSKIFKTILSNPTYWKIRCNLDYCFNPTINIGIYFDWENKYLSLYNSICKFCYKKTKCVNYFYNDKVCKKCAKSKTKYLTICKTDALKQYCLAEKDLFSLKHLEIPNYRYCSRYPMKLYLKSDIIRISYDRYFGEENLKNIRYTRLMKKHNKIIRYIFKHNILDTILFNYHSIKLDYLLPCINIYTKGLYIKYILNIGNVQKIHISEIIQKCLELDFILKYYVSFDRTEFTREFEYFAEYIFLTEKDEALLYSTLGVYLTSKLDNLKKNIKQKINRKNKIIEYFGDIKYCLSDFEIYSYISDNTGNIHQIKFNTIMENFLVDNVDYTAILLKTITADTPEKREEIYREEIMKCYNSGGVVPEILYDKYIRQKK
jgi:hypothetical protein